jgi:paired radical SAM protein 2
MKQVKALYKSSQEVIVGRVTLKNKNFFNRASYIFVTEDNNVPKGYKAVISAHRALDDTASPYIQVDSTSDYNEGDVINITSDGEINFLYENNSVSNTIFATARCNHRCIMCPQPPVLQEKDRTDFNLKLIKLFNKHTQEVGITGGEPTMIGDRLFEIIHQIKKSCPKAAISILSNGVKFADIDYAAKLAVCNHYDLQIDVPIFSDVASVHNHIVGANTFYKTVQGLYNLAQFGQKIGIRVVIHKQTYRRLAQLADYIYHNFPFVTQVAFMQMETIGLAETNLKDLWIDPYNYNNELKEAILLLNDRGITACIYNAQLCVLPPELRPFAKQSISEWKKIYLPVCNGCTLKCDCGGFFSTNNNNVSSHIHKIECANSCTE